VVTQLILTVTRACNLRCSYCPTAKDGWPSLDESAALRALALFTEHWGGGDIKLFGGEPLLVPDVVRAVVAQAAKDPKIRRVYVSTNGLGLNADWLALFRQEKKAILTISLDGRPEDNRRHRRALPSIPDAYDHLQTLLPELVTQPRLVITQTVAPSIAGVADLNFLHLLGLGFRRFNFLPGYYIPWRKEQLDALAGSFDRIRDAVIERWQRGERLYVRNLFTLVPTPFFNTGVVVDSDGSIHPNNLGLSGALEELLPETRVGSIDDPPTPEALSEKAKVVNALLEAALPEGVWDSTLAVDRELTRFCQGLYGEYAEYRRRRRAA
jgi:MoaA/NifB/PqqE/SkfB family radical SAM enzyme